MEEIELLHAQLPCPACSEPVHVVANPDTRRSRWACTACHAVGEAPLYPLEQLPIPPGLLAPVASA